MWTSPLPKSPYRSSRTFTSATAGYAKKQTTGSRVGPGMADPWDLVGGEVETSNPWRHGPLGETVRPRGRGAGRSAGECHICWGGRPGKAFKSHEVH